MPNPKDPQKLLEYRKKMSRIAKERGYGKWMTGKTLPQETIQKMRESQLALITPEERQARSQRAKENGVGKWMAGRKAHPGFIAYAKTRKGKTYTAIYGEERADEESVKRRISNLGKTHVYSSDQAKENLKTSIQRTGKSYQEIYGADRAIEEATKRSQAHQKRWEGKRRPGCRDKKNGEGKYKKWRTAVFTRDNYICQKCLVKGGKLHAHHIKPWSKFPLDRYNVENGITLCINCHGKEHPELKLFKGAL